MEKIFSLYFILNSKARESYDLIELGVERYSKFIVSNCIDINKTNLTIPITLTDLFERNFSFAHVFYQTGLINNRRKLEVRDTTIISRFEEKSKDKRPFVESPIRITLSILNEIQRLSLENDFSELNIKFIIILPSLPPPFGDNLFEKAYKSLKDFVELVDKKGFKISKDERKTDKDVDQLDEYLQRIKYKMIKRIGYFKRGNKYYKYFYDGEFCDTEIITIFDKILNSYDANRSIVFYDCKYSKLWLGKSIKVLKAKYNSLKFININEGEIEKNINSFKSLTKKILLVDLINTGNTINRFYNQIRKFKKEVNIDIFTIIACSSEVPSRSKQFGVYQYHINNICNNKKINFLFQGNRIRSQINSYYLKYYGKPTDHRIYENDYVFNSYIFWNLVQESLFIPERNIPKYQRGGLTVVPNFENMIKNYGAFITKKIKIGFKKWDLESNSYVFICPDESGASVITKRIQNILSSNVIKIPRRILKSVSKDINPFTEYQRRKEWFKSISGLNKTQEVVILDDFTVTNGTLKSLKKFIYLFNQEFKSDIKISCFWILVDFSKKNLSSKFDPPILSLYEINLNFSKPLIPNT